MIRASGEIILASQSPRRKELLSMVCEGFQVKIPQIEEKIRHGESITDYIQRNAQEKVQAVKASDLDIVIAADTVVVCEGELFEKPVDIADARRMLKRLREVECHSVYTALCVQSGKKIMDSLVHSRVFFRPISDEEIECYVQTQEPYDKSGAYAVQGYAACFIKKIEGSYTNVVGLPLAELIEIYQKIC
jgi:septum formation protein